MSKKAAETIPEEGARPPPAELHEEVFVPTTPRTLRNLVVSAIQADRLLIAEGRVQFPPKPDPAFLGEWVAAVKAPLTLSPDLTYKHLTDSVAFKEKVEPTVQQYLKELAAARSAIAHKKAGLGSLLGQPVGDIVFGGKDYRVAYQSYENGAIFVIPPDGQTFEVHGAIYAKYKALGGPDGFLGFPETDELPTSAGSGRFNQFHGGSIYWTLRTGAWSIHGDIRSKWFAMGAAHSYLGFPLSDVEFGAISFFERGSLQFQDDSSVWHFPDTRAFTRELETGGVKCSMDFWMNSSGSWSYNGHVHNGNAFGRTVSVATSPRFQSADGHVWVATAERSLGGWTHEEDRSDDWMQSGQDDFIRDHWNELANATFAIVMKTETQIGDVVAGLWPFVAAAAIIIGAKASGLKACGPYATVKRDYNGNDVPSVGFQLVPKDQPCPGDTSQDLFPVK
jgi:hypothetical protein